MSQDFHAHPPARRLAPRDSALELAALYLAGAMTDAERIAFESSLGHDEELRNALHHLSPALEALADAVASEPAPPEPDPPSPGPPSGSSSGPSSRRGTDVEALLATIRGESRAVSQNGVVRDDAHGSTAHSDELKQNDLNQSDPNQNHQHEDSSVQIWRGWNDSVDLDGLITLRAEEGAWEPTGVPGVEVRRLFVDRAGNRMTAMFRMAPGSAWPQHRHDGFEECYVITGDLHVGDDLVMRAGDFQRAHGGSHHPKQWTESGCVILVSSSLHDELD